MSKLERVLEPNSPETPTCLVCGEDMYLARTLPSSVSADAETREYHCYCGHVLRLAVWKRVA
jgi:hypothetical protein